MSDDQIKTVVREKYGEIAKQKRSCCGLPSSCCGSPDTAQHISQGIGYTEQDLSTVPEEANLGLGCGNPVALASLREGETVLDLGSGAGLDCFLAAQRVGQQGKVIGVDMTPAMIDKARENAKKGDYRNVEFRLGEIENLPAPDNSVDAVISNCVINLSPEKSKVFTEAFRVLKPGGRLMISDIVLLKELPEAIKNSVEAYVGCISGAMGRDEYLQAIETAGFEDVRIMNETAFPIDFVIRDPVGNRIVQESKIPLEKVEDFDRSVASISVQAAKPS